MNRNQFTFYRSFYDAVKVLPKKEQTAVILAICAYALDNEEPNLTGTAAAIFTLVRPTLDSSRKKAESGKRGGETKHDESKPEAKPKQSAREKEGENEKEGEIEKENECYTPKPPRGAKFTPPTVDEVTAYCRERNKGVDPERWYNHYTANGWKVGKNQMKDWKAAVRTWEPKGVSANEGAGRDSKPSVCASTYV